VTPRDPRTLPEIRAALADAHGPALRRLAAELADDERTGVRSAVDTALRRERARQREVARLRRLYALEAALRHEGWQVIAGIDEVGRGALAGPLTAGACVLPAQPRIEGLDDSKRLAPARREQIAEQIRGVALCWSVAHVPASDVDALGMTAALRKVMGLAIDGLAIEPDHIVVDGRPIGVRAHESAVIGGDGKVAAVAAASVLAKVARDAHMRLIARDYPDFGFEVNKGYGTLEHLDAVRVLGPCIEHRRSFLPAGGHDRLF
jgi:ribonuclease HII